MQVVYSGGSSTPSPSPHLQRKNYVGGGYGRPIMPGYIMGHPHQPAVLHSHRPSREKLTEGDASLRDSIPAMSKPVALTCLILNVVLPGLGTLVSGLTVLCGSQVRPKGASRRSVVCTNSGVALVQFFLAFLFLLGWIWSIMWGTAFLSISKEYYKKTQVEEVSTQAQPKQSTTPKREHHRRHDSSSSSATHHEPLETEPSSRSHDTSGHASGTLEPPFHRNGLAVNAVSGTLTTAPDLYLAPPVSNQRSQPIIVLQEAPTSVNHSDSPPAPSRALMSARTRHEKILQRQMSDNELSPFILTHQKLEAIVIHDAPVLCRAPRVQASHELDPDYTPLPKL